MVTRFSRAVVWEFACQSALFAGRESGVVVQNAGVLHSSGRTRPAASLILRLFARRIETRKKRWLHRSHRNGFTKTTGRTRFPKIPLRCDRLICPLWHKGQFNI